MVWGPPPLYHTLLRSDLWWTGERWDCGTDLRGPHGHVDSVAAMEQRWLVHHNNDIAYHTHIQSILQYYYHLLSILFYTIYWPWTIFLGWISREIGPLLPLKCINISDSNSVAACEAWVTPGAPGFGFLSSGPGSWSSFNVPLEIGENYPPEVDGWSSCSHLFLITLLA